MTMGFLQAFVLVNAVAIATRANAEIRDVGGLVVVLTAFGLCWWVAGLGDRQVAKVNAKLRAGYAARRETRRNPRKTGRPR